MSQSLERALINATSTKSSNDSVSVDRFIERVTESRAIIEDALEPRTRAGRLRKALVNLIPNRRIQLALEDSLLEEASGKLRGSIHNLYDDGGIVAKAAKTQMAFLAQVKELYIEARKNPNSEEALAKLRLKIRESGERDLGLEHNKETDALFAAILNPEDEDKKAIIVQKLFEEAEELIDTVEILMDTTENAAIGLALEYDSAHKEYSKIVNVESTLKATRRAEIDILEAQKNRVQAFRQLRADLNNVTGAAVIINETRRMGEMIRIADGEELKALKARASQLKDESLSYLPRPKDEEPAQLISPEEPKEV